MLDVLNTINFLPLAELEVGQHFYWELGSFKIHGQILLTSWFVIALILLAAFISSLNVQRIPSGMQNFMESVLEFIRSLTKDQIGENAPGARAWPILIQLTIDHRQDLTPQGLNQVLSAAAASGQACAKSDDFLVAMSEEAHFHLEDMSLDEMVLLVSSFAKLQSLQPILFSRVYEQVTKRPEELTPEHGQLHHAHRALQRLPGDRRFSLMRATGRVDLNLP